MKGIALAGIVVVALAGAGCRHTQTRAHRDTVTKSAPTTGPTHITGASPAEKGRNCVLAAGGEDDPVRALNECRDSLARLYGVNSTKFAKAWQEADALATCLTYTGVEICLGGG